MLKSRDVAEDRLIVSLIIVSVSRSTWFRFWWWHSVHLTPTVMILCYPSGLGKRSPSIGVILQSLSLFHLVDEQSRWKETISRKEQWHGRTKRRRVFLKTEKKILSTYWLALNILHDKCREDKKISKPPTFFWVVNSVRFQVVIKDFNVGSLVAAFFTVVEGREYCQHLVLGEKKWSLQQVLESLMIHPEAIFYI